MKSSLGAFQAHHLRTPARAPAGALSAPPRQFALLHRFASNSLGWNTSQASCRKRIEEEVVKRAVKHGCNNLDEYLCILQDDDNEMQELINQVTIPETEFFRTPKQIGAFVDVIVPDIMQRNRGHKQITVWSAGCSTGEEAYSLAMPLQGMPNIGGWQISIVGTDVNTSSLQKAKRGTYELASHKYPGEQLRHPLFQDLFNRSTIRTDRTCAITDNVRRMVSFQHHNLTAAAPLSPDVIFCRQVLIYFSREWQERVLNHFHDALAPGGYLFLGYTETDVSSKFHRVDDHSFVYQKV